MAKTVTDIDQALEYFRRPLWKRMLFGLAQGFAVAVMVILVALLVSELTGSRTLAERADRNAQITVEGVEGVRCVLTIRPDPEREYKDTQVLIDECYAEFDQLVGGEEDAQSRD